MTVIDHRQVSINDVNYGREYEVDEPEVFFYVERSSRFIYEVKLFPDFVLARLAMPDYQPAIQRIDMGTFLELFEEYCGDIKDLRKILFGNPDPAIIVSSKNAGDE